MAMDLGVETKGWKKKTQQDLYQNLNSQFLFDRGSSKFLWTNTCPLNTKRSNWCKSISSPLQILSDQNLQTQWFGIWGAIPTQLSAQLANIKYQIYCNMHFRWLFHYWFPSSITNVAQRSEPKIAKSQLVVPKKRGWCLGLGSFLGNTVIFGHALPPPPIPQNMNNTLEVRLQKWKHWKWFMNIGGSPHTPFLILVHLSAWITKMAKQHLIEFWWCFGDTLALQEVQLYNTLQHSSVPIAEQTWTNSKLSTEI